MRLKRMMILLAVVSLTCLTSIAVQAEEQTDENVQAFADVQAATDELGVGTTGYGSPVRSESISTGEIYSGRSGYIHPFLSVGSFYTDNLFNDDKNEESDWVAVITPGVWLARPASHQKLLDVNTSNTAPGGLALSRFETESERRLQTYALYRADIREHDKFSSENHIDHRAEGMVKLSLRGGLSLELLDVYEINRDPYGTGGTPERRLDEYNSNLLNITLGYKVSPKVRLRASYSNYQLDYDEDINAYRNRQDDSLDGSIFYTLTPKTSVFLQSEYIWIDYDNDINSDSKELNVYIGLQMNTSAKTKSRVKVGYGAKDYESPTLDDRDEWVAEGQIDYFFTPKTSLYLKGVRRVHETDSIGANDILTYRAVLGYRQRFTSKLRGEAAILFRSDDYDGIDRKDDYFGFTAAFGFSARRWLNFSLGYEYRDRDSSIVTQDYRSNICFLRVTAAL